MYRAKKVSLFCLTKEVAVLLERRTCLGKQVGLLCSGPRYVIILQRRSVVKKQFTPSQPVSIAMRKSY